MMDKYLIQQDIEAKSSSDFFHATQTISIPWSCSKYSEHTLLVLGSVPITHVPQVESQVNFSREEPAEIKPMMTESEESVGEHVREKPNIQDIYIYM